MSLLSLPVFRAFMGVGAVTPCRVGPLAKPRVGGWVSGCSGGWWPAWGEVREGEASAPPAGDLPALLQAPWACGHRVLHLCLLLCPLALGVAGFPAQSHSPLWKLPSV